MLAGSCLCGRVRYEIAGKLGPIGHCHCSTCRKSHGAAFGTHATVRPEDFRWVAGEELVASYESSPGRFRRFCRNCGSTLTGHGERAQVGAIAVATLDTDPGTRPVAHIMVHSKVPWFEITDSLPQFAGLPSRPSQ
jgi:hypothetical protein